MMQSITTKRWLSQTINRQVALFVATWLAILVACTPTRAAAPDKTPAQKSPTAGPTAKPDATPHTKTSAQTRALARDDATEEKLSTAELESRARKRETARHPSPYNKRSRKVHGTLKCPKIELVTYKGAVIAYNRPVEVNKYFKKRLIRFERIVARVAVQVYGRAPSRIVQASGYACKTVGGRGEKLSEHVFGHAIDISGFEFDAADGEPRSAHQTKTAANQKIKPVDKAFKISLKKHWNAKKGLGKMHSLFLHKLADALKKRGPFSTMLGPAYKGHNSLFHFDSGPQFFFRI